MIIFEVAKRKRCSSAGRTHTGYVYGGGTGDGTGGHASVGKQGGRGGGVARVGRYLWARRRKGREDPWLPKKKRG